MNRFLVGFALFAALPLAAQQTQARPVSTYRHGDAPTIQAAPLRGSIDIDGRLDDAAWQNATPVSTFTQRDPQEGQPASERTEVRILIGDDAIYVGARLFDKPANIRPRLSRRDEPVDGDVFAVSFDSRHDHISGYYFRVTAGGAVRDAQLSSNGNLDMSWDAVWEAKVHTDSAGWSVEIRVPLSQLAYNRNAGEWGVQFERYSWNKQEQDFFAFTPKSDAGGIARFAHLTGLGSLPAPGRVELMPYVSTRAEYLDVAPGNPFRDRSEYRASAGVDFKYRLASNLTLNATINPDFGQVEVDPAVVNLSAFETFFPEKRPFFVAERSLFDFGTIRTFNSGGSPTMFFSRRIGRQPQRLLGGPGVGFVNAPEASTIASAVKVTGKSRGGWTIGILDGLTTSETADYIDAAGRQQSAEVEPLTNYFVSRVRREMNEAQTAIGTLVTAVNRDLSDPGLEGMLRSSAYVGGVDVNHSWGNRAWLLDASFAASNVAGTKEVIAATQLSSAHYFQRPDADNLDYDPGITSMSGYSAQVALTKGSGLHWGGNLAYQTTSPGFESNDIGFMRTADRHAFSTDLHYMENKPGKVFRDWLVAAFTNQTLNSDGDFVYDAYASFFQATLPNFSYLFIRGDFLGPVYDDRLTRGGPLGRVPRGFSSEIDYSSDRRKRITTSAGVSYSRDVEGQTGLGIFSEVAMQPAPGIRLAFSPQFSAQHSLSQFVTATTDATATNTFGRRYVFATLDQTSLALVTRADWTLSPTLSLQLFAQPFVASGGYRDFKELRRGGAFEYAVYGRDQGTVSRAGDTFDIDPDSNTATNNSIVIGDPDFNFRSLRGNAVVRWEYRPGSTLYFVWQQQRSGDSPLDNFRFGRDYGALFRLKPENVFTIKASYWLAR